MITGKLWVNFKRILKCSVIAEWKLKCLGDRRQAPYRQSLPNYYHIYSSGKSDLRVRQSAGPKSTLPSCGIHHNFISRCKPAQRVRNKRSSADDALYRTIPNRRLQKKAWNYLYVLARCAKVFSIDIVIKSARFLFFCCRRIRRSSWLIKHLTLSLADWILPRVMKCHEVGCNWKSTLNLAQHCYKT